jgi:alkylhydroperoxidase family enzyme
MALQFADKMARNANAVGDDEFEKLLKAGFTESEIKELLGVIDLAMMFNCYTSGMRLPLDPQYKAMLES